MKKLGIAISALVLVIAIGACSPADNRLFALNEFRKAGASEYVVSKFDCYGYRESRWQEDARHKNSNGSWDLGIFQINSIHQTQFQQVTGENYWTHAIKLHYNVKYAIWLWKKAGLTPWRGAGC